MRRWLLVMCALILLSTSVLAADQPSGKARAILDAAGVKGGVIVHLSCGDGTLTAELWEAASHEPPTPAVAGLRRPREGGPRAASDAAPKLGARSSALVASFLVHGLDTDAAKVRKARAHILSLGLGGKVAADTFDGAHLPYVDNMVNLLIADDLGKVTQDEVLRVLAPGGVALVDGKKSAKPWPKAIDEWTHYLHDADNNAVANDTVVGPPRRLQWQCGPKWTRHHDKMSSLSALVSSGGRIFYILDEGLAASIFMPSHWALIARDAFNGKLLWKRAIGDWYTRFKGLKDGPADAPRRLVAAKARVYTTLGLHAPLVCLDAETGRTLRNYQGTKGAEEILLSNGVLFLLVGPGSIGDGGRGERPAEKRTILALEADTGKELWRASDIVAAMTMAVDGERLYYYNFASKRLSALDRRTGERLWASEPLPAPQKQRSFFAQKLVVSDGVVLFASGEYSGMIKSTGGATKNDTLTALAVETGKTLWKAEHPPSGYSSPENLFVIDGTVWCDTSSNGRLDGTVVGYDLKTGEQKHKFPADKTSYWFHHRCHPGKATTNYIMTSRTGIEFIDFRKKHWDLNHWVRGACLYGIMPANGLLYTPPAPCICYAETYLHSFNAFAPAAAEATTDRPSEPRLVRGPAFGAIGNRQSAIGNQDDWPTYRRDSARSGRTTTAVPAKLSRAWKTDLGGKLSSVTIADGKVFVAAVDEHTVHALDAVSGAKLWHYTAGGRVDSPPTYSQGSVLFGSADGRVYCLRASDGELVWRFRAGPTDRRILSYEQIESLWPVHGSILVRSGIAHFVAGRSAFVDGGLRLVRLEAATGKVVSETPIDERNPKTGKNMQELVKWLNMPVGRPDVLSCDGKRLYMRSQSFDLDGKRLAMGPQVNGPQEGARQGGEGTHLFCPTGFLDDSWFHRTYWLYARTWGSGWCGYYIAGKHAPAGKILCVGDDQVYVFGRRPQYYRWTTPLEYRLFAARKEWNAAPRKPQPAAKAAAKGKKKRRTAQPTPVTNKANYAWTTTVPILVRAMALADRTLFIAGPADVLEETGRGKLDPAREKLIVKQEAAYLGKAGAVLRAVATADGRTLAERRLPSPPVFDGMAAAKGRLYIALVDGSVVCLGK